jgi:hypothetical protein
MLMSAYPLVKNGQSPVYCNKIYNYRNLAQIGGSMLIAK